MNEAGKGTYTEVGDLEVVEDDGVTGGTLAETDAETREVDAETELLGPCGIDVGQGEELRCTRKSMRHKAKEVGLRRSSDLPCLRPFAHGSSR